MRTLLLATAAALFLAQPVVHAAGDVDAGRAKSEPCAACHGPEGNTPIQPDYPILAGQYADYLARALLDYQTGKRTNPIMVGLAANLSEQDRLDLAAFFASQKSPLYTPEYADELASTQ